MTILRGHGNTMDTTRWPRKVVEWVTREKCEGGRPKGGCREDMKEAVEGRNSAEEGCYRREGREETGGGRKGDRCEMHTDGRQMCLPN
jgi:hypothetical protein